MAANKEETCAKVPRAERIARLNDELRQKGKGGALLVTNGVRSLAGFSYVELIKAIGAYEGFDHHNDPHGERDFGDLDLFGAELLWKIDYYDRDCQYGSEDPADAGLSTRVLTVMLAVEY